MEPWYTWRRWLARLAFSLLILTGVLVWDGYTALTGRTRPLWQSYLEFAIAGVSLGLALAGTRLRHRLMEQDRQEWNRRSDND